MSFPGSDLLLEQSKGSGSSAKIMFGGDGGGVPHVPIPNTTVKPSSADGTWTEGSWESRTLPSKDKKHCRSQVGGAFFYNYCELGVDTVL